MQRVYLVFCAKGLRLGTVIQKWE